MAQIDWEPGELPWDVKLSCGHWRRGLSLTELVATMAKPHERCSARSCNGGAPTSELCDNFMKHWTFAQVASGEWRPREQVQTKVQVKKRSDGLATRWRKKFRGKEVLSHLLDWQCTFCETKTQWHSAVDLPAAFSAWDSHKATPRHIDNLRTSDAVDRLLGAAVPERRRSSETAAADRFPSGE